MKLITVTHQKYQCEICNEAYDDERTAQSCEAVPLRDEFDLQVGDEIEICNGYHIGRKGPIHEMRIIPLTHYVHPTNIKAYHHTKLVSLFLVNGGHTTFNYDQVKLIKKAVRPPPPQPLDLRRNIKV